MAGSQAASAGAALDAVFAERILLTYARGTTNRDLAELDAAWHQEVAEFTATAGAAHRAASGTEITSADEQRSALATARAAILVALIDPDARSRASDAAHAATRDERARRQPWFMEIANGNPASQASIGQAVALASMHPIAVSLVTPRNARPGSARRPSKDNVRPASAPRPSKGIARSRPESRLCANGVVPLRCIR